jgi:preprotein translocase SecE subunit
MAVATKQSPETSAASMLDRLPVACLAGLVYVVGSLAIVFKLLPTLWREVLHAPDVPGMQALLALLMVAAAVGLIYLGARLLGPRQLPGLRGGVAVGLVGLFLIVVVVRWIGFIFQSLIVANNWFGASSVMAAAALTGVVGLALLIYLVRLFLKPTFERRLVGLEEQGWFSATFYKRSQGQRVRRGTMLGLLIIVGCGIYTMLHRGLVEPGASWEMSIPFTGREVVKDPGDTSLAKGSELDAREFQAANADLKQFVKIAKQNDSELAVNSVVPRDKYDAEVKKLRDEGSIPADTALPIPATGTTKYQTFTLLPDIQFTLPLILGALALWLSWRIVNYPTFADFLIATEAELNKVSWTTRRRLVQDTIVVLVTVVLLTVFLLVVDTLWSFVLGDKVLKVLRLDNTKAKQEEKADQEQPW